MLRSSLSGSDVITVLQTELVENEPESLNNKDVLVSSRFMIQHLYLGHFYAYYYFFTNVILS